MYRVYQVLDNDTIESIADKFHTDVETIQQLNDIETVMPKTGIVVPRITKRNYFMPYIVKQDDNLYEIAKNHHIDLELLLEVNGLDKDKYIHPGQEVLVPKHDVKLHITKEGETLQDLVHKFHTDEATLAMSNEKIYLLPRQLIVHKKKENW